jgi:DNA-binding beta-propeller fold protein YncE
VDPDVSSSEPAEAAPHAPGGRRGALRLAVAATALVLGLGGWVLVQRAIGHGHQPTAVALPLKQVGSVTLPGDGSRFDYASLDTKAGLLFVAHLGTSQVIEVDVRSGRTVRVIDGVPDAHGVLVVPALHRVYATATGANTVMALDEDSGAVLFRAPTGDFPDGIAYDPTRGTVWTTNESGGTETVVDAATGRALGTVALGGEAGNNAYDPGSDRVLVDVQTKNILAEIDPASLAVTRRLDLPGCDHDHGLALDSADRLAFVACDGNARLLTVDLAAWRVTGDDPVGVDPDVLGWDPAAGRLYVACESGWLTLADLHGKALSIAGSAHFADGSHVVAVDPATHRSYYPVPSGPGGGPAVLIEEPAS